MLAKTEQGKVCTRRRNSPAAASACTADAHAAKRCCAAGAIGSPQILQLSGIGPARLLQQHGIAGRRSTRPASARTCRTICSCAWSFKVTRRQDPQHHAPANWFGKMKIGMEYALFQSGPMSMAPSQLGAFARSDPAQATPNLQYHVQPLSLEKFGEPLHPFPAFTASVCNLRPTSRGHVRIASRRCDAPRRRSPPII